MLHRAYHCFWSYHLQRDMELLQFGERGARVLVFPTRDGKFYDYENWRMVEAVREKIEAGHLQLFCLDSYDRFSLYADWMVPEDRIARHEAYERYVLDEVLPWTETLNPNPFVIAHGCSLGAFHAVNIALRHPHRFGKIVAFSGRYDLTQAVGSFRGLFDGFWSEAVYFNTPSQFMPLLPNGPQLDAIRQQTICLTIGLDDVFLENNRRFSHDLREKQIEHTLHEWDGEAHRPRFWRPMAALYL